MTTKYAQKCLVLALIIFCFLSACRKAISVPAPELEKLFGSWVWVRTTGGAFLDTITTADVSYTKTVVFNRNGICKRYKNGKQTDKLKFSLSAKNDASGSGVIYFISYKNVELFDAYKTTPVSQFVDFLGQDTLVLLEDCDDGQNYLYVREK